MMDNRTVLVAEDHPVNMRIIRFMLEKENCLVHEAENGREAVDLFDTLCPDIVILDIQMPEMDGLDACRKIRELERKKGMKRTPVSALSANASAEDREEARNAGMDYFISKPVTSQNVSDLLKKIFDASPETEPPDEDQPLFGYETLLETFGGSKEIVQSLLGDFLTNLPDMMDRIEKFLREEDFESLERTAHSLKGQTLNLHASAASETFAALERASRERDREAIDNYRDKCEEALVDLIRAIQNLI